MWWQWGWTCLYICWVFISWLKHLTLHQLQRWEGGGNIWWSDHLSDSWLLAGDSSVMTTWVTPVRDSSVMTVLKMRISRTDSPPSPAARDSVAVRQYLPFLCPYKCNNMHIMGTDGHWLANIVPGHTRHRGWWWWWWWRWWWWWWGKINLLNEDWL